VTDPTTLVARLRAAGCVFAEDEAALVLQATTDPAALEALVVRRCAGEPLEQVLGWAEFDGLRVAVRPGVFVPRHRTTLLVRRAAEHLRTQLPPDRAAAPVVVDLCCGTGAVGLAVTTRVPGVRLWAADLDPVAVACAAGNLAGTGATVLHGDLDAPLPRSLAGAVDVLVANVPYVPSAEIGLMPPEARDHEPGHALDGGADGLDLARRVMTAAPRWLAPGGLVLVETSGRQAPALVAHARAAGLEPSVVEDDDLGATAVLGVAATA
jgi:release factor glutamine methyltransferase